jgi:hypothetical protein
MPDTNAKGAIAEGAILAALLATGKTVLLPFGTQAYDLVFEDELGFHRVQVKSGRDYRGALVFHAFSRIGAARRSGRSYAGRVDYFGIYLHATGACYLIPIADVSSSPGPNTQGTFRLHPPKNNQNKGVRLAEQYLIKGD